MHEVRCDFFGLVFENMGGPERPVDACAQVFEFRGQAAVDDVDTTQKFFSGVSTFSHEEMLPPPV